MDMRPVRHANQYPLQIFLRDGGVHDIFQYERKVSLPDCKE